MTKQLIIAIDGCAASGKGTLARLLGEYLGFGVLDTGLLYRLFGYMVVEAGCNPEHEGEVCALIPHLKLDMKIINAPALRKDWVAQAASKVSVFACVREALLDFQRQFAYCPPVSSPTADRRGAILDGRDIGTYVLPEADFKIYVTANIEIRALRRWKELQSKGLVCIFDDVLKDLADRDHRDMTRTHAPLKKADDAYVVDTSYITAQQAFDQVLSQMKARGLIKDKDPTQVRDLIQRHETGG